MNTVDRMESLENESLNNEMSYLYGRDPSILAFGQRPFPSHEIKKNLISALEEEKDKELLNSVDSSFTQTIKVFLRIKPFLSKTKVTTDQATIYSILNSTTLLTKIPSLDNTSCLKKNKTNEVIFRKFTFTKTFGAEITQLELFEQAVKPQMIDFLLGKNSVVMSYGTTNSGKTYTLQGTSENPGIIPRAIEFVFSNINPQIIPYYKPINFNDVIYLNNIDRRSEIDFKIKLLSFNTLEKNDYSSTFKQMQKLLQKESPVKPNSYQDALYSVWISFAEIYNETIYDLLWNGCQKKRPALKLTIDNKGRSYIKGLKSVCVHSGSEAYQVLMVGQYNLKVAATALNSRSSRSHCIFTIKLLKYKTENDPNLVDVSTFAFCDLAGSERLKKTLNVGERLKEAQNINTSLLVLGRCLKTIYESQNTVKQKNESIGPFRESKLTRLFQRALSGKEQIALIVNVNPLPNLYVETQNVLNFSAIAKQIVVEVSDFTKPRSQSRFSQLVTQSMKTDMDWETTELDENNEISANCYEMESGIEENKKEAYEDLLVENEILKKENQELKTSALARDIKTRQEMTNMYSEIMKNLESDWKDRMIDMEAQQEDLRELAIKRIEIFYKEKLNQLNLDERSSLADEKINKKLLIELESENSRLISKIGVLKKYVCELKQQKNTAETEKSKIIFELFKTKEEAKRTNEMLFAAQRSIYSEDCAPANYIKELKIMIEEKNERIKKMKTFLNEAKEEYISITNQVKKLENQIKKKDEFIAESREYICDLIEQINQVNECSAEQNKKIENLEEELEFLLKQFQETKTNIKHESEPTSLNNLENEQNLKVLKDAGFYEFERKYDQIKKSLEQFETHEIYAHQQIDETAKNFQANLLIVSGEEQEKSAKTLDLRNEIEILKQLNEETIRLMESNVKSALRKLNLEKEISKKAEEKYVKLDEECRQVVHIFEKKIEALKKKIMEKETENNMLKLKTEEFENKLIQNEHEQEEFTKNRKEKDTNYEALVEIQCDEFNCLKIETKNLTSDIVENTSGQDFNQKKKLDFKKEFSSCILKESVESITKNLPNSPRKTRRKKLYTYLDESYVDIESGEV